MLFTEMHQVKISLIRNYVYKIFLYLTNAMFGAYCSA